MESTKCWHWQSGTVFFSIVCASNIYILTRNCWKMASLLTSSTVNKPAANSSPFNWQTVSGVVNGLSIVVKCLCASLSVGYLLSFSETALDLLTVSPGKLMPPNFWIWTILTHCFIEVRIDTPISVAQLSKYSEIRLVCRSVGAHWRGLLYRLGLVLC